MPVPLSGLGRQGIEYCSQSNQLSDIKRGDICLLVGVNGKSEVKRIHCSDLENASEYEA
jgi:hypothetical protein